MKPIQNTKESDLERGEELLQIIIAKIKDRIFDEEMAKELQEATDLFEKWKVKKRIGEVHKYWGHYQSVNNQYRLAIENYQKSLDICKEVHGEQHSDIQHLHTRIGNNHRCLGDFQLANKYFSGALKMAIALFGREHLEVVEIYEAIGVCYFEQNQFFKAIEAFQQILSILEKIPSTSESQEYLVQTYSSMATNYSCMYDYEKSLDYYQKTMVLCKKLFPPTEDFFSTIYLNYGVTYSLKGDMNRAILMLQKSVDVMNYNKDVGVLYSYKALMDIYNSLGKPKEVLRVGEEALQFFDKTPLETYRAINYIYSNMGIAYQSLGNYEKAHIFLEKAIEAAVDFYGKGTQNTISPMLFLGRYHLSQENYEQSEVLFQTALKTLQQDNEFDADLKSRIWSDFGDLYLKTKQWSKSIEAYHKSSLIATGSAENQSYYQYPFVDLQVSQSKLKLKYGEWLLNLFNKATAFWQYYQFSSQKLKDLKAAFQGYEIAFGFLDQVRQSFESERSKLMLIKTIEKELLRSIDIVYMLFEDSKSEEYLSKTFEFSEKCKAHLMLTTLQEKTAKQNAGIPNEILSIEHEYQTKLTMLQKNIQSQKQKGDKADKSLLQKWEDDYFNNYNDFENLKKQLETDYPDYYLQKYSTETISIKSLQSSLQENQTVLSYFIGEEKIYLFAITTDECEVFALEKSDNWTELIQNYLQSIKLHQKERFQALSFELYQILLQEAMHHIIDPFADETKQVFIVPHAELHYLPFETLLIADAASSTPYQEMNYLLNHCNISYHYSATLLHLDLQKQQNRQKQAEPAPTNIAFTGFAPVYESSSNAQKQALELLQQEYATAANRSEAVRSDGTWMPLPYSKIEVENISQLFEKQGLKSQSFLHETANKSNLEEQIGKSRFVLIAAHGIVNNEYPELSGLVMAEDGSGNYQSETTQDLEFLEVDRNKIELQKATDDCILNMKEVAMIPMSADLVVLSSCESGIGELHQGEGMMAVNRGFLSSGAKNVISTLFKVNDRASSELTQLLFQYILKGENYATALQKAKLELLAKEGMSPKAWSGFVLFGTGES